MDIKYNVENELKQEYLSNKPTNTAIADSFVMRSADKYEQLINKSIYNMTYAELKGMLMMQFKNSSLATIEKNISILKTYIDFCINKKVVAHGENRLLAFTTKDLKKFIHQEALLNKYVSKERLEEYHNILYNPQDQLLIRLPHIGVRGRTTNGGTLEEIINLKIDDLDEKSKLLKLNKNNGEHRIIDVDIKAIELIKETYETNFYVENNGEQTANPRISEPRKIMINKFENYVLSVPSKNKYQKFTSTLLNSRMRRIQNYLDNHYLTYTALYMSGMIDIAINIYKEKGEINKDDYIDICARYDYGTNGENEYWYKLKNKVEQYIDLLLR
jgi:integrase